LYPNLEFLNPFILHPKIILCSVQCAQSCPSLTKKAIFSFNRALTGLKVATEKLNWVSTQIGCNPGKVTTVRYLTPVKLNYLTRLFNFWVESEVRLVK
jgi:hypothetical protein